MRRRIRGRQVGALPFNAQLPSITAPPLSNKAKGHESERLPVPAGWRFGHFTLTSERRGMWRHKAHPPHRPSATPRAGSRCAHAPRPAPRMTAPRSPLKNSLTARPACGSAAVSRRIIPPTPLPSRKLFRVRNNGSDVLPHLHPPPRFASAARAPTPRAVRLINAEQGMFGFAVLLRRAAATSLPAVTPVRSPCGPNP